MTNASRGTRQDILDTALHLFVRQGYNGTSIRQITSALEITPAALYYHFPSKESVLTELIRPLNEGGEAFLERIREVKYTPDGLRFVIEGYYDLLASNREIFGLVATDLAVRSSDVVKGGLRHQARELFEFIAGPDAEIEGRIRAAAAIGTMRRAIELPGVDVKEHRGLIVDLALRQVT